MSYQDILFENETKYKEINEAMYGKVIEAFQKVSSLDIHSIIQTTEIKPTTNEKIIEILHNYLLSNSSTELELLFRMLEQYGFNLKGLLSDYVRALGFATINRVPDKFFDVLLRTPIVDKIECQKGIITIYSDKFGEYSFCPIRKYFRHSRQIRTFLNLNALEKDCHNASWDLIQYLKSAKLITLLLPNCFKGTLYHTVIEENGKIIDAAFSNVYDIDTFFQLMEGTIVCETKKEEMYDKLAEIKEKTNYANALLLALHHQSKL